jgi:hypothetical protein
MTFEQVLILILFILISFGIFILLYKTAPTKGIDENENKYCNCHCKEMYLTDGTPDIEWRCACCGKKVKEQ